VSINFADATDDVTN